MYGTCALISYLGKLLQCKGRGGTRLKKKRARNLGPYICVGARGRGIRLKGEEKGEKSHGERGKWGDRNKQIDSYQV
jgi:hypothetical protein